MPLAELMRGAQFAVPEVELRQLAKGHAAAAE
jgi:hypothetical protein